MELHHQDFGGEGNPPIILLHGLLGSSRNWVTVGKLLSSHFHVYGLDLRNHGSSPHDDRVDYPSMAKDVLEWMDLHALQTTHLVGHSMGGKVAMRLACEQPERVLSLTIADIAPRAYNLHFRSAFRGMRNVDPSQFARLSEVENALAGHVNDASLRQFLITNLKRTSEGTYKWQINHLGLETGMPHLSTNPLLPDMKYEGPCKLLYGEKSDFVTPSDWDLIRLHFPQCQIIEVPEAGHNVHIENRNFFTQQIQTFAH